MFVLLASACKLSAPTDTTHADTGETTPAPGPAVAFDEVLWGEAGSFEYDKASVPCVTAYVESLSSDAALKSIATSWLTGWELPEVDWKTQTVLVVYIDMCTNGGSDLEMTDVWDTGGGTLQVDLTFHRGGIGTA
jgi:hypothetical protein